MVAPKYFFKFIMIQKTTKYIIILRKITTEHSELNPCASMCLYSQATVSQANFYRPFAIHYTCMQYLYHFSLSVIIYSSYFN